MPDATTGIGGGAEGYPTGTIVRLEGVCVYCLHFTGTPVRACKTQANGKDYGHDYSYDEEYIALTRDYLARVAEMGCPE